MKNHYDVIVMGVGAMGASACFHLALRGLKVLGLERFDVPHDRGSSHGYSRLIRQAYYEHPDYVPLLLRAYENWEELERMSGRRLLVNTGGLYVGHTESGLVSGSLRSAREHGLAHELLDHGMLAKRFPQFAVDRDWVGLYEPAAGYLLAEKCVMTMCECALRKGCEIHAREEVTRWESNTQRVIVETTAGSYTGERLIICGGAWAGRLLGEFRVPLRVSRQVVGWVWPKSPEKFEAGRFPIWALQGADGAVHYGAPMDRGALGLKVARHEAGATVDPDAVNREKLPGDEESFRGVLARHLPEADGELLAMNVCLYTNTPDSHFILDEHPLHKNVHFACGFSGHGFKFASVVGEIMADMSTKGRSDLPVGFLGLGRLGIGKLATNEHQ